MVGTLIIFGIFVLAAFYSGFYFGYLKAEEKPPERMPIVTEIKELVDNARAAKNEPEEPRNFFD
jgi:hypothetical protein